MDGSRADAGRVVLVMGASSGIGRVTARAFAESGARLVLAARSGDSLAEAAAECRGAGAEVLPMVADSTDRAAVDALFGAAEAAFGRVDVVVHCSAAVVYGLFSDIPPEVFDAAITSNVLGTANVARAALRHFGAHGGGSLIIVGSLLGKIAVPYMGGYVVGKWATHALARTLQIEARQIPGVQVSLVSPGSVNTPAYIQAANYVGREGRPPPPIDEPEKVAAAIVRAADRPRRDRSVGLFNEFVVFGFRALPFVYDRLVTPLIKLGGLSRRQIPPTSGNVLDPQPHDNATHGRW